MSKKNEGLGKEKKKGLSKMQKKEERAGYLFAAPWLIGFFVFTLYPLVSSLIYSFTNYSLKDGWKFIGLTNYRILFTQDSLFYKSVTNTLFYAVWYLPLNLFVGFGIALLMNMKVKGIRGYRTMYNLPTMISGVATAMVWGFMFQSRHGIINQSLGAVGIQGPAWLSDPIWSKIALVIMSLWGAGGSMLIYLAGLNAIPKTYYEAAEIDGARTLRKFWHITIPLLSPTLFLQLITGIIGVLQVFSQALLLTGEGTDNSTVFYVYNMYNRAFTDRRMGYACAMGWILFVFTLIITVIVFRFAGSKVYYETGE